jgi:hypothetical protein
LLKFVIEVRAAKPLDKIGIAQSDFWS